MTVEGEVHHREIMSRIYDGTQELLPAEYMPLVQQLGLAESYDRQQVSRIIPLLAQYSRKRWRFRCAWTRFCSALSSAGCAIRCCNAKKPTSANSD